MRLMVVPLLLCAVAASAALVPPAGRVEGWTRRRTHSSLASKQLALRLSPSPSPSLRMGHLERKWRTHASPAMLLSPSPPPTPSPPLAGLSGFLGQIAKNMKQMTDQRVGRASHIMLRPSASAAETLDGWKVEIADDEDKFQARARKSSQCRSAPRGGDLGFVTRGKLSPEFDEVIFEEEPGYVYGPIRTQFGYHLIYLHSCREPTSSGGIGARRRA
eukprot:scaffold60483_cov39-Tisochrysis_lutea.AAC.1